MAYLGCLNCQHMNLGETCKAFPKGIPLPILSGELEHTKVLPGQSAPVVFEKMTEKRRRQLQAELDAIPEDDDLMEGFKDGKSSSRKDGYAAIMRQRRIRIR